MMEMAKRENIIIYMPHPRSKGSTGYPDAVKDTPHFRDENYRGIGYRWGMGVDGSETRLCEYRCLDLLDDMNNWVADLPTPPKFIQAITETYRRGPGDDIYANNPVNYVKVDTLPDRRRHELDRQHDEARRLLRHLRRSADPDATPCKAAATSAPSVADVEWTFPLDFVEVVWGDGTDDGSADHPGDRTCRRSASTVSRSRSTPPARSGCGLRCGTSPATARSCSR